MLDATHCSAKYEISRQVFFFAASCFNLHQFISAEPPQATTKVHRLLICAIMVLTTTPNGMHGPDMQRKLGLQSVQFISSDSSEHSGTPLHRTNFGRHRLSASQVYWPTAQGGTSRSGANKSPATKFWLTFPAV